MVFVGHCNDAKLTKKRARMIESKYWKESLKKFIPRLQRREKPPRWTDRLQEEFDRDLCVCFFQIRKMWELHKLSDEVDNLKIKVNRSQAIKEIHFINFGCLEENYDFVNEEETTLSIEEVCHQFVHSKVLWTMRDETRNWSSVYLASDFKYKSLMYRVEVELIKDLFELVAEDYIVSARIVAVLPTN